jgi:hypothetical protein
MYSKTCRWMIAKANDGGGRDADGRQRTWMASAETGIVQHARHISITDYAYPKSSWHLPASPGRAVVPGIEPVLPSRPLRASIVLPVVG